MNPLRIAIGLAAAGVLVWSHILAHRFGADGVRLEVAQQAAEQVKQAQDKTQKLQEQTNAAQTAYTQAQSDIADRDRRIRRLVDGMRNTPSANDLAQHTSAAIGDYAADLERDFAECRAEFAAMGNTAASASTAAHALNDAWPDNSP